MDELKVFLFNYPEGWMILYYKNGKEETYYNCDEDDFDKSLKIASLLGIEPITYKFKNYKEFGSLDLDIFNMTNDDFKILENYRLK